MTPIGRQTARPVATLLVAGVLLTTAAPPNLPLTMESARVLTLAGNGQRSNLDGQGEFAQFNWPTGVVIGPEWSVYVADYANHLIRRITPDGVVTTLAGSNEPGAADGRGTAAQFQGPDSLAIDQAGRLYVADADNFIIRKVTPDGVVTTIAGSGQRGDLDGPALRARFNYPTGIAVDRRGVVYIADRGAHKIKKLAPDGRVTTLAGSGIPGYTGGMGRAAQFHDPMTVVVDDDGRLYVADSGTHTIRMISPSGKVTTLAGAPTPGFADGKGTTARFNWPTGIARGRDGNLYIADSNNARIRRLSPDGVVTTVAGNGHVGYDDGPGQTAQFSFPTGLAIDTGGNLYVADSANHRIRRISRGEVFLTTCCLEPVDPQVNALPRSSMVGQTFGLHAGPVPYYTEERHP